MNGFERTMLIRVTKNIVKGDKKIMRAGIFIMCIVGDPIDNKRSDVNKIRIDKHLLKKRLIQLCMSMKITRSIEKKNRKSLPFSQNNKIYKVKIILIIYLSYSIHAEY